MTELDFKHVCEGSKSSRSSSGGRIVFGLLDLFLKSQDFLILKVILTFYLTLDSTLIINVKDSWRQRTLVFCIVN